MEDVVRLSLPKKRGGGRIQILLKKQAYVYCSSILVVYIYVVGPFLMVV
jgi:hypothetical protein